MTATMDELRRRIALRRYRLFAPIYDILPGGLTLNRRLRHEAVSHLRLARGQTVLDVGCGTGLSFELLEEGVGPEGRLIGVELSPDMLARARSKVARRGWQNATLIEAAAEEAAIPAELDACLFFFAHDVMQSEPALGNVLSHVKAGGRVVAAGGKRAEHCWQLPARAAQLVYWPFVTTTEGAARPWVKLARLLGSLTVEERLLGAAYIAYGIK